MGRILRIFSRSNHFGLLNSQLDSADYVKVKYAHYHALGHIIQVLFGHDRLRLSLTVPRLHRLYSLFSFLHQRAKEEIELHSSESHSMAADCKIKIIRYRLSFPLQEKLTAGDFKSLYCRLVVVSMYHAY